MRVTGRALTAATTAATAAAAMATLAVLASSVAHAQAEAGAEGRPPELRPEPPPPPRILEEERARGSQAPGATTSSAETPSNAESTSSNETADTPQSIADTGLAPALAAPRDDGSDDLDEVLVVGTPMRLPDLGSTLRAQREAEEDQGRIAVTFLPLYDPEAERGGIDDPLFRNREMERVGFIELFRIRFGHRSRK